MSYHKAESIAPKKRLEREAVELAMQSRWEDAAKKNRAIIAAFPADVDSYNRLGRALVEMGSYADARQAYNKALELDPHNSIARKNLTRMSALADSGAGPVSRGTARKVSPQIFVGEFGKVGTVNMVGLAPKTVLAKLATGDEVVLKLKGQNLIGETTEGEHLGDVEPSQGLRLAKLMHGGNRYTAAIAGLGEGQMKVVIKETYQDPSQEGRLSFPARPSEGFRPYVREGLLRADGAEDAEEPEAEARWEGEDEEERETLPQGFSFVGGSATEEEE